MESGSFRWERKLRFNVPRVVRTSRSLDSSRLHAISVFCRPMLYFILQIMKEIREEHDRLSDHSTTLTSVHLETLASGLFLGRYRTGSKFSSYGINSPSIISGTSSLREELNSESLSERIEGELEREDMFLFLCFPSSHFFCYITCCDYDVREKPAVVISRALQVCWSSNGGRDFTVFWCLFHGIALLACRKFYWFKKARV